MPRMHDRGMSRRDAVAVWAGGAWAARRVAAAETPLRAKQVDHIEFWVSDVERSRSFYTRIFGNTLLKNNRTPRRYVQIGSAFLAMDQGPEVRVDHVCAGIEGFQIADVHAYLAQRGIAYKDYPSGRDLYVADPDGTRIQLGADHSWDQLIRGTASPETVPETEAVFRPTGVDHVLLNVSDPEQSAAFFEKILGPVAQRNNGRIWFPAGKSRIGLLKTPAGQRAGVNHFCVAAEPFEYEAVVRKLEAAGARVEKPEVAGAPEFRDPDGYLVQVMGPRKAG